MKILILTLNLFFSSFVMAQNADQYKFPKLKTVGVLKHKVTALTEAEFVMNNNQVDYFKKTYIAKWGEHRYEVGLAVYACSNLSVKCTLAADPKPVQYFDYCAGFNKEGRPLCSGVETFPDAVMVDFPNSDSFYKCDVNPELCQDQDPLNEYPGRSNESEDSLSDLF